MIPTDQCNPLDYTHHIHHDQNHKVHHCGGAHNDLGYTVVHCKCGKHRIYGESVKINKPLILHGYEQQYVKFIFDEICPEGGFHVESGKMYL